MANFGSGPTEGLEFCKGCIDTSVPDVQAQLEQDVAQTESIPTQLITELGAPSGSTGQVTVTSTATLIKVRNGCRRAIKVTNLGTTDIFIGLSPSVTTISGDLLVGVKGAFIVIPTTLDVYAIVATGTQAVSFMELSE